jgi:hypothetical protein
MSIWLGSATNNLSNDNDTLLSNMPGEKGIICWEAPVIENNIIIEHGIIPFGDSITKNMTLIIKGKKGQLICCVIEYDCDILGNKLRRTFSQWKTLK